VTLTLTLDRVEVTLVCMWSRSTHIPNYMEIGKPFCGRADRRTQLQIVDLLGHRRGYDLIILILQQNRLRWYGHVLRKEDTDWVKKSMEYEVEGSTPRGTPKRTWKEVVQKDCQARNLNKEDAMDRGRWKKLIKVG